MKSTQSEIFRVSCFIFWLISVASIGCSTDHNGVDSASDSIPDLSLELHDSSVLQPDSKLLTTTQTETPQPDSLGQFAFISLPFSSDDLFFAKAGKGLKYKGIEGFDPRNFAYYHIPKLNRDTLWPRNVAGYYPAAIFKCPRFELIFLMRMVHEPGFRDPEVVAYLANARHQIKDSLVVHDTYAWENSLENRFSLDRDTLLTISDHSIDYPNYGQTHIPDSLWWIKQTKNGKRQFRIGRNLRFVMVKAGK